ncbi:P-loop containing nucleoside triphosphate hydrolase protein [Flammula alnicola]|nr:P-loop containing nucleoside triphosphate hydrolase protein [Flammula alnicola]
MPTTNYTHPTYCIPFVTTGCSFGRTCSLRHDIFKCSCGLILLLAYQTPHLQGKRHQKLLLGTEPRKQLRQKLQRRSGNVAQSSQGDRTNHHTTETHEQFMKCEHCRKQVENAAYDAHVEEHIRQQHVEEMNADLERAAEDKEGVTVTGRAGVDFGILDTDNAVEVTISVTSANWPVALRTCRLRSSNRGDEHGTHFSARLRGKSRVVQKEMTRQVSIILHPAFAGHYEDTLELVFFNMEQKSAFVITRRVEATVGSREDHELLKPKAPYSRRKILKFNPVGPIVPSSRPPVWTKTAWVQKLPLFNPPRRLIEAAYGPGANTQQALSKVKRFMPVFDEKTYGAWFQVLLYIEEERVKLDLDAYSLTEVELQPDYPRYKLLVEGLAENRPSVLVGDFILVSHSESSDTVNTRTWHEGRVHKVYEKHVSLHFGSDFSTYRGTKFDVRFVLNRLPYRRMYQALVNKFDPIRFLFPGPEHIRGAERVPLDKIVELVPFYRPLGEDEEQMETVAAIVNQKPGSVPFVVFGPPGTGKTVTIVEAMQQLLAKDPNIRILACAPNNSAADTIAQKLISLGRSEVFRLNSLSRRIDDMPKGLRDYSIINDNSVFAMPTLEQLAKYRVVVSTCLSAGVPAGLGLKRGHFTHIFIDEAGQGKEPEVMVPIKSIANAETNVILAGDNQQLGPIVHSNLASSLGLKTSYLARIMQREIYNLESGRGITIVKLVKNFRSHPDILRFSNEQFYNSELQTCDEREASSPSFFNIDEVTQVKKYCLSLVTNRKNGIRGEHIGVITPYHAQRCKILDLFCKDSKLRDIKVGSVEEFQGQERRVIVISTVRSNKDFVTSDIRRSLGFVANKTRLNVALTRAQALLIVIGNPVVLSLDPIWRAFLNYVHKRGGWRGKHIDWDPEEPVASTGEYSSERKSRAEGEMEETIARLKALILEKHGDDGYEIDSGEDDDATAFERPILREAE